MSGAERFALAGALLLLLLHAGAVSTPQLAEALEYRRVLLGAQPWRLLTGHLVHINWPHALINAAAWVIVARLFARELAPLRQGVVLVVTGCAIGAALALSLAQVTWYRGFSGVLHALFFTGATLWFRQTVARGDLRALWLPLALVLGGWIKVVLEQPAAGRMPYAEWLGAATVPQAHLLGAACGTLAALVFARWGASGGAAVAREKSEQSEQEELRER